MNRLRNVALLTFVALASVADAGQPYLVTDRFVGQIDRLEDLNGDGDALDVGERLLWGEGLSNAAEMVRYQAGVLVVDSVAARARYFQDLNHDGDALDAGESIDWADGLTNPYGIGVGTNGSVFLSDFATHQVFRAQDLNHDGDALDGGEKTLYAENIQGALSILTSGTKQFVLAYNGGQVHGLNDGNGDGDALDTGENIPQAMIPSAQGIAARPGGGYYVGSPLSDAIYGVVDRNGDGDALDDGEVLSYADNVFGGLNDPWGLEVGPSGELLVANASSANILMFRDRNGDGDALDFGESTVFADGIAAPLDILAFPSGVAGDYNQNGVVDAADYTVWRDNLGRTTSLPNDDSPGVGLDDFTRWKNHFGQSSGSGSGGAGASIAHAPEPAAIWLALSALIFVALTNFKLRRPSIEPPGNRRSLDSSPT